MLLITLIGTVTLGFILIQFPLTKIVSLLEEINNQLKKEKQDED